jgi:hypothetical protein
MHRAVVLFVRNRPVNENKFPNVVFTLIRHRECAERSSSKRICKIKENAQGSGALPILLCI